MWEIFSFGALHFARQSRYICREQVLVPDWNTPYWGSLGNSFCLYLFLLLTFCGKMCDCVHYYGFHGTSADGAEGILREGFEIVKSDDLYLGNGAYFFIGGISNPYEDALNYVSNVEPKENPTVVKADIIAEKDCVLDLDTNDGLKLFNHVKKRFFEKRIERNEKMSRRGIDDGKIINFIVGERLLGVDLNVVVSKRTLPLKKEERELNLHSMLPNCIFCCVKNIDCISNVNIVNQGG